MNLSLSSSESRTPAGADPLQLLREATQALHQRLDASLPLSRAGAGLGDYLEHLQVVRGWLAQLDPLLLQTGWASGYLESATEDLPADLAGERLPCGMPCPEVGPAFAWGLAYVVEGSQLGGLVLARRLRAAGVDHPLSYLQGRGAHTGAHWGNFLAALRAALVRPEDVAAACRGARWAFDDLLARFDQRGLLA